MKITCPYCAIHGTLANSLIHKNIRCPRCKQIFRAEAEAEFVPVEDAPSLQAERIAPPPQEMPPRPAGQRPERIIVPPDAKLAAQPLGKITEADAPAEAGIFSFDEESAPATAPITPQSQVPAAATVPPLQTKNTLPPDLTEEQVRANLDTLFERKPLCASCGCQIGDNGNFSSEQTGLLCQACRAAEESVNNAVDPAKAKPAIDWGAAAAASGWRRENELREIALSGGQRTASPKTSFAPFLILCEAWEKLKGVKRDIWGAVAIIILVNLIFGAVIHFLPGMETTAGLIGVSLVGVIAFFLNTLLLSGLGYLGLCQARGQESGWDTVFVCFSPMNLVKLLILFIIQPIVIILGLLCLVVPGIYLAVTLSLSPLLILDKGMWPWQAMLDSRRESHAHCLNLFLVYLAAKVAFCAAAILGLVGLFWMLPFVFVLYGVAYRRLVDGV